MSEVKNGGHFDVAIGITVIGAEEVNSTNSRDLHSELEIKTPYSMWIQRAIEKYGFEEGVDFTIHKFVNGKATQQDFIVTLDMAKELCMVDDSLKGRAIRKYFIEAEKKSNSANIPPKDETTLLLEAALANRKALTAHEERLNILENTTTIDYGQQMGIQKAVKQRVAQILDAENLPQKEYGAKLYSAIYQSLYEQYNVASYRDLPKLHYADVLEHIANSKISFRKVV